MIEEFRQRYLNQPYGDQPMLLRALAYKVHPYRWATIGLTPDHIAQATLDDVQAFYRAHYHPSNAILSVSADFDEERMLDLAEKWFAPLADRTVTPQPIPREPQQEAPRRETVERDVPATTFAGIPHGRPHLAGFLYRRPGLRPPVGRRLVASLQTPGAGTAPAGLGERLHFGRRRPGLFVFTGQLLPETTPEQAEAAFRAEIEALQSVPASDYEVEKVKNKFEANTLFGELNVMNKAMNLGFYEMLGDLPLVNARLRPTVPSLPTTSSPSAAARSGPKTVPPSFTKRANDTTTSRNTRDRRGPHKPKRLLANGSALYTLASDDFEVLRITFVFRAGSAVQRVPFSASAAANMLAEGTRDMTAQQIAEQLDYYGSYFDVNIDRDYAYISFCTLSKFFDETLAVAEQILLHPVSEEELRTYCAKRKQRLAIERTKVDTQAREAFARTPFSGPAPLRHLGRRSPIR